MVEEQSPAHPAWRAHLISQHPPNEADAIVRRNRIFGLIAVGGCKHCKRNQHNGKYLYSF